MDQVLDMKEGREMDMDMEMMQQEPKGKPQIMEPPYVAEFSDSIVDDESDAWVISNERGSVAEMTCPFQDAEVTARFFVLAGNSHKALVEALRHAVNRISLTAEQLETWARQSREGGWSTHQVDPMRAKADVLRREASAILTILSAAQE